MAEHVSELRTRAAVAEQRIKANEARLHRIEDTIGALQSHLDKSLGAIALLVVAVPIALQIWGG